MGRSEFYGVVERPNGSVVYRCCDCGKFIKYGEETQRVIPQFGEPADPEYEFVHAKGFGCAKSA
jgi:hypothetical protein